MLKSAPELNLQKVREDKPAALVANMMDSMFRVPGTKIRFGLDPLLSLIPGGGSSVSTLVSLFIIGRGAQRGLPKTVLARMGFNVLLNSCLDAIPVVGGPLTAFFRSNARNHELLQRHAGDIRAPTLWDRFFVFGLIAGLILLVAALVIGTIFLARKLWALARM